MTARLRRVLLVEPGPLDQDALDRTGWLPLNEKGLREQFNELQTTLESNGVDVIVGGPSPADNPDAIYAYDGVLVTRRGIIAMRSGKLNRRDEPTRRIRELEALGIPTLGAIRAPGQMDAGDTLWLRPDLLAVGLGHRTNVAAARQLADLVAPLGVDTVTFDLCDYRGPEFCLHLMSLISLVNPGLAVIYRPLMPVRLLGLLSDLGVECIEATRQEFDALGTNLLALGDDRVVIAEGSPRLLTELEARGIVVNPLFAPDLCYAGTGGPTCLTRPVWRADVAPDGGS